MAATNHTPNYDLPLFVNSDKPSWLGDFNGAMSKIDTAIKQASESGGGEDAQEALTKATQALTAAQTADTKASNAQASAQLAITTGNTNADAISSLQSSVQEATQNATTALQSADSAQTSASSAISQLSNFMPSYFSPEMLFPKFSMTINSLTSSLPIMGSPSIINTNLNPNFPEYTQNIFILGHAINITGDIVLTLEFPSNTIVSYNPANQNTQLQLNFNQESYSTNVLNLTGKCYVDNNKILMTFLYSTIPAEFQSHWLNSPVGKISQYVRINKNYRRSSI